MIKQSDQFFERPAVPEASGRPLRALPVRRLRLVGGDEPLVGAENPSPASDHRRERQATWAADAARREVALANLESAFNRELDPRDPRWLVALATSRRLQGALLSFESRRTVLALAHRIGVRAFDANLIIAAVQDRARRGEPVEAAMPTVALAAPPSSEHRRRWPYAAVAVVAIAFHAWLFHLLFS